jgi:hypothetical protein
VATVADDVGTDFDRLLAQAGQRPLSDCLGHRQRAREIAEIFRRAHEVEGGRRWRRRNAIGPYAGKREEAFTEWRDRIREVASLPDTFVKLGGLGMKMIGFTFFDNDQPPSSQDLEKAWRPYIETCITAFGPQRSMFESNFPVDKGTCSYQVLWNAFKRIAAGYSADEKTALFSGAASKAYRLAV